MRISVKALFFSTILVMLLAFSCSDGDEEELTMEGPFNINELAGNWNATRANFNGNTISIDVVEEGGTLTMTVQSSGRFIMTIDPVDRNSYTVSGEMFWEKWEGEFYFAIGWDKYPGEWETYGATLTSNTLTINGGFDSGEYDFDNDGTFEPVSLNLAFDRI